MTRRKAEPRFGPFADDASVRNLGGLAFENGHDRIGLHGSLDITRDKAGLALARELHRTIHAIISALESQDLPDAVTEPEAEAPQAVKNPFA